MDEGNLIATIKATKVIGRRRKTVFEGNNL